MHVDFDQHEQILLFVYLYLFPAIANLFCMCSVFQYIRWDHDVFIFICQHRLHTMSLVCVLNC